MTIAAEAARKSYEELTEHELNFTFQTEPWLAHSLSMAEIKKISAFFKPLMQ